MPHTKRPRAPPGRSSWPDVVVPSEMVPMIECGEHGKAELRLAMEYVEQHLDATGPCGERILYNCEDIHFRAPVPNPEKIFSMAINNKFEFERCIKPEGPAHPLYFSKYNSCLCGAYDDIEIPISASWAPRSKWYLSLARAGKNVPESQARDYHYGFTVHNAHHGLYAADEPRVADLRQRRG